MLSIGCGDGSAAKDSQPSTFHQESKPTPQLSLKKARSDEWLVISTQFGLLALNYRPLAAKGAQAPDFCFKLGHLLGRAATLSALIEQTTAAWELNETDHDAYLTQALALKLVALDPRGEQCNAEMLERLKAPVEALPNLIQRTAQYL